MGTPSTGSSVCAEVTPARCAAPPAPQIKTSMPASSAPARKRVRRSGVRCAEITRTSISTERRASTSSAGFISS
jgi:hypothetical protein